MRQGCIISLVAQAARAICRPACATKEMACRFGRQDCIISLVPFTGWCLRQVRKGRRPDRHHALIDVRDGARAPFSPHLFPSLPTLPLSRGICPFAVPASPLLYTSLTLRPCLHHLPAPTSASILSNTASAPNRCATSCCKSLAPSPSPPTSCHTSSCPSWRR